MKYAAFALAAILVATPAHAQLGGLRRGLEKAKDAKAKADKLSDMVFTDKEERQLGEYVSGLLIDRFGVYQDPAVQKYVTLVGSVLAQSSSRPNLNWEFIVLDTDGVNAYAAPGGLVHITRGALGLIKNEAELAGVLGHEIAHITQKHTIKAIQKANATELGIDVGAAKAPGGGLAQAFVAEIGNRVYTDLFENAFDRGDEMDSDKVGTILAGKLGYDPAGMNGFLNKVSERNKGQAEPNGVFASHPQTKERIDAMTRIASREKLTGKATVATRYATHIKFDAKPLTEIKMDIAGVRGAVGDAPAEKKKGGFLSGLTASKSSQSSNTQTVASAGSRGGVPDRDAVGGSNKTKPRITITPAEIEAFKKGIAAA